VVFAILLLLLAIIFFGTGFALHGLWIGAIVFAVAWLVTTIFVRVGRRVPLGTEPPGHEQAPHRDRRQGPVQSKAGDSRFSSTWGAIGRGPTWGRREQGRRRG
jgi:hypothetical protein